MDIKFDDQMVAKVKLTAVERRRIDQANKIVAALARVGVATEELSKGLGRLCDRITDENRIEGPDTEVEGDAPPAAETLGGYE